MSEMDSNAAWAPQECTLPTVERPSRVAEFDQLFARTVRRVDRPGPDQLRLELEPAAEVAAQAAHLVVRETKCCSFFTFVLTASGGALHLEVSVPAGQVEVLDALAALAGAATSQSFSRRPSSMVVNSSSDR